MSIRQIKSWLLMLHIFSIIGQLCDHIENSNPQNFYGCFLRQEFNGEEIFCPYKTPACGMIPFKGNNHPNCNFYQLFDNSELKEIPLLFQGGD